VSSRETVETEALVVRTVEVGEVDVVATLFTERLGKLGAMVRGARKGSKRVGGALEPVHTIAVLLEDRGKELTTLKEARIVRVRGGVVSDLEALDAAGVALRWARHVFPPRTPEPDGWQAIIEALDALDERSARPRVVLARAGLRLLAVAGYSLDLERCVVCGRACPEEKVACVDPARGGLVCRACGGASAVVLPSARRAARALEEGRVHEVAEKEAGALLDLVERALAAHAGFEG
jgi:DNA repair protein RecO (recombination protein O)